MFLVGLMKAVLLKCCFDLEVMPLVSMRFGFGNGVYCDQVFDFYMLNHLRMTNVITINNCIMVLFVNDF